MPEELFDIEFIEEKIRRATEVFMNRFTGAMYFEDPDNDERVFSGYDQNPWGTTDPLLFSFKLDDYEIYTRITPEEAIMRIREVGAEEK